MDEMAEARQRAEAAGDKVVWETPQNLVEIVEAQRAAAARSGCAFFSLYDAMGGRGSIDRWARESPPKATGDRVHLTREGYQTLAQRLVESLMHAYAYHLDQPRVAELLGPEPAAVEPVVEEPTPAADVDAAGADGASLPDGVVRPEPLNLGP